MEWDRKNLSHNTDSLLHEYIPDREPITSLLESKKRAERESTPFTKLQSFSIIAISWDKRYSFSCFVFYYFNWGYGYLEISKDIRISLVIFSFDDMTGFQSTLMYCAIFYGDFPEQGLNHTSELRRWALLIDLQPRQAGQPLVSSRS